MPAHIVNLGSSFAAGPGIHTQINTAAKRSSSNYAHMLASQLGTKLTERYGKLLDAIHVKAPKAQIVVVEYLTLIGLDTKPAVDVPFTAEGLARHQRVAEKWRMATGRAIYGREPWCVRIAVGEASREHGPGSKAPWVVGFGLGVLWRREIWYHPNAEGMQAVANIIHRKLEDMGLVGNDSQVDP